MDTQIQQLFWLLVRRVLELIQVPSRIRGCGGRGSGFARPAARRLVPSRRRGRSESPPWRDHDGRIISEDCEPLGPKAQLSSVPACL
jgi:hypothetical protein